MAQVELTLVAGSGPRWFNRSETVTRPGTNRARRRVTMSIDCVYCRRPEVHKQPPFGGALSSVRSKRVGRLRHSGAAGGRLRQSTLDAVAESQREPVSRPQTRTPRLTARTL